MTIAIPLFHTRVAPRFDCARSFLLAEVEGSGLREQRRVSLAGGSVRQRIEELREMGVEMVVCGGIDVASTDLMSRIRMQVLSWVTGEAEAALQCLLCGELVSGTMVGPGGRGCGRWKFVEVPCRGPCVGKKAFGGRGGSGALRKQKSRQGG
jgi:predicted Fe-Mo cluster-binding NifX family protein